MDKEIECIAAWAQRFRKMKRKWGEMNSGSEKAMGISNGDEWTGENRGCVYREINTADEIWSRRS